MHVNFHSFKNSNLARLDELIHIRIYIIYLHDDCIVVFKCVVATGVESERNATYKVVQVKTITERYL